MDAQICQQCKEAIDATVNRLVRDSCGHYKCRSCVVKDSDGCRTCLAATNSTAEHQDSKQRLKQVISVTELQAELNRDAAKIAGEEDQVVKKKKREGTLLPKNIVIQTDEQGTWYNCTVCDKRSRARSHITYHAYCDGKIKPHICSICQKGFSSRSHYEYHMRVHEGRRPFICDTCGLGFYQKSKLKRHVLKHTGEKRFPCTECGAAFNNAASLRKHGFIHSGVKPHKCTTCNKQFRDSSNLRKHQSKHKNEKFPCGHCGKQYGLKWSLMLHQRSHGEARPYRCPLCPQAFYSNKDMRRHAAVHSDNKPYRCLLCGTRFRRKDNLDRHLRNTHPGVDPSKSYEIVNEHTDKQAQQQTSEETKSEKHDDYTEQNILEANNKRQTVIFGPIKQPEIKQASEDLEKYKEKHFKKKITNMEIYRNILVPEYSERAEKEKPDKPIPEYIHKKVNYELMKRDRVYCSQVPPISADNIDRIVRETLYCPQKEYFEHPPENIELYKKILMPDYKNPPGTSSGSKEDKKEKEPTADMHWRRRMAMNTQQ